MTTTESTTESGVRDGMRALFLCAIAALCVLAGASTVASPALAARGHEFAGAFGWGVLNGASELQRCAGEPTPDCEAGVAGSGAGQFNDAAGIAVNEVTGDVYVVDKANNRVEIFNAAGSKFEGEFNGSGEVEAGGVKIEGKAAGSGGLPEEVQSGRFEEPEGIAIDNSCFLHKTPAQEAECEASDPSAGDVYVADHHSGEGPHEESLKAVDKFSPTGKYIGQITRNPNGEQFSEFGFAELYGVAVDPGGEVWVEEKNFGESPDGAANYTNALTNAWIDFRSTDSASSAVAAQGFAVDSEDNLYVHNTVGGIGTRDRLAKFNAKGELLSAELDEEAPTGVAVEAASGDVYISHASNVHRVNARTPAVSLETLNQAPGTPGFSGVAVDSSTLTVLAADNAANRIDVFSPEVPHAPTVQPGSTGVADVTAASASFSAEVNPRSEPGEEATSYTFRYGPCESVTACAASPYPQSIPSPDGVLAANFELDRISAHLQELLPGTVYHMRVFARNSHSSHGEAQGEELIFTTQTPGPFALPDARHWELVSPPDKHGALLLPAGEGVVQAAAEGGAVTYLANAMSESEPAGFANRVQILSRRGASSWVSQDIGTPHETPAGGSVVHLWEYMFFAGDLSSAVIEPLGPFTSAISPQASEQTLYLRSDFPAGDTADPCVSSCYRPLATGCPGGGQPCPPAVQEAANVPEGTKFGLAGEGLPSFLGASPDASHVVFSAGAQLVEGAPLGAPGEASLYEWAAGRLALVSVLPDHHALAPATQPALGYATENGSDRIARHAISANGNRVVFSEQRGAHHLFLRDMARKETVQLDAPEAACVAEGGCGGTAGPVFQTAAADGSRVLFTDTQPLTQSSGGSDLYECRVEDEEEGPPRCGLSDLTPRGGGEEPGVLGLLAGASEDDEAVYFTANAKLTTEPSPHGEAPVAGDCKGATVVETLESETAPQQCNLYVRNAGQTRLVAVLSGADFPDWSLREGPYGLAGLTDRVSPDGRYLAFMSRRPLTGYDNHDAVSGQPDQEVFLYDESTHTLVCASCDPTGGRPHGVQYKHIHIHPGLSGGFETWPTTAWIAADVPGWSLINSFQGLALYQHRYLDDSGRLFFNSADALVPQDTNSTVDVYQYEPPEGGEAAASDSCTGASTTYSTVSRGCVSLISSGTGSEESAFLDASESGDDVFFLTAQRLLPKQDLDTSLDAYDAHACTTSSPCLPEPATPPPACEGDACQSPGAPPEEQTPGSLTFQGPGNLVAPLSTTVAKPKPTAAQLRAKHLKKALAACHKIRNKHKRHNCEMSARKKYGVKAVSKHPSNKRRTR